MPDLNSVQVGEEVELTQEEKARFSPAPKIPAIGESVDIEPDFFQKAVPMEPRFQHTYRETTNTVVKAPYGLTSTEIEDYDDFQNYDPTPFEAYFLDPLMRGVATANQTVAAGAHLSGMMSDGSLGKDLMESEMVKEKHAAPPAIKKDMETILLSDGFGDALKNIVKHPAGFYNLLLESATSSIPGMTVGMAFGPTGSGAKAAAGRGLAFGAGSGVQEYASSLLDMMGRRQIDMKDETAVRAVLNDGDFMKEARERGMKRGAIIGMIDALSAGFAGKIGAGVGGGIKGAAAEVGAQAIAGGGGEALGQIATDGGITSPAEVLLEGVAETVTGIPEIMMGREAAKVRIDKQQGGLDTGESAPSDITAEPMDVAGSESPVAAQAAPVYDERTIFNMSPEDLETQARQISMSDDEKLVEAFGSEEKAKLFKKLDRQQNSMNIDVADRAGAEMDELTKDLTPEQERLIYGIGETGATAEDFKELLQAHSFSEFDQYQTTTEIAATTANAMMWVDPIAVMSVPTDGGSIKEQAAFIRITKGIKALRDRGVPKEQIAEELVKGMVSRGNTESNAVEIVGNFIEKIEAAASSRPPTLTSPENLQLPTPASGGGQGGQPPTGAAPSAASDPDRESDYAKAAATPPPKPPSNINALGKDIMNTAADWFVPMSTRLGNIHESLKHAVRKFTFNVGLHTHNDKATVQPFIEGVSDKMTEGDYRILDLALKNGDAAKVDALMTKYGLTEEYAKVRGLLDQIFQDAKQAGMDVGFLENYFPRKVRKDKVTDYLAYLQGREDYSLLEQAMGREDPNGTMTPEERVEFANKWLRGYKNENLNMSRTGNIKERTVDYIDPEMNGFYQDSMPTLIDYIGGMRYSIEVSKLLGADSTKTDESIGKYVLDLIDAGIISREQELEVRKILKAVVKPTGTHGWVTGLKNVSYIYSMGSPISAITQLGDLAMSLYNNGYYRTAVSITKALRGKSAVTREDVGISDILHEFEDKTSSGDMVRKVFKLVGIQGMDKFGKEVLMDGAITNLQKAAKKGGANFQDQMDMIFGAEANQVIDDLKSGTMSENVRFLAYSELADFQPISIAEMPVYYANAGNGRIFYQLKSYTVRQLDIYRREIFGEMAKGNVGKGLGNLISLGSALMLMGMSADALKDLLLGREIELDDLVMDNILKTVGFTKYQIYKSQEDGFLRTFFSSLFVPAGVADDIAADAYDLATDEKDIDEVRSVSGVPVVGKFYYWWLGGGEDK